MINLAVVGSGYWGSKVVESLNQISNVGKIQVIDVKNGQTIDDIDTDIRAAIIATPLWDHFKTAQELLERGFDCYIEKPMAETAEEVAIISDYARSQIIMVGHIFVYHPALEYIKLQLPRIGEIKHIHSERLNWGIYQTKTTPLLSLLPHDVSILLELCTNIQVVSATKKNFTNNVVPDYVSFDVRSGEITATVVGSWYWPERVRKLTIIGSNGHIVWDDAANNVKLFFGSVSNKRTSELIESETHIPILNPSPLQRELSHFVECVASRKQPITDVNNALEVAKILDDVQELLNQDC
jgi:UDP-2-acetamido-3-amino-2,3-dideoxy-glucuronate N-acetyltransferase